MAKKNTKRKYEYYLDSKKVKGINYEDRVDLRNLKFYPVWSKWKQFKFHISLHNERKFKKPTKKHKTYNKYLLSVMKKHDFELYLFSVPILNIFLLILFMTIYPLYYLFFNKERLYKEIESTNKKIKENNNG